MLYEFGITPDTFQAQNYRTHHQNEVSVVQLLRGISENGLIANLHRGNWLIHVQRELATLSPRLSDQIQACLKILDNRHRIVRHRKCPNPPASALDWFNLLRESDNQIKFHQVILGDDFSLEQEFPDDRFTILGEVLDSALWLSRRRTLALERTEAKFREVFANVLRHAKTLDIIDPYVNPSEEKWRKIIRLLARLMGQRHHDRLPGRIRIHTDERQIINSDFDQPNFHLGQWQTFLGDLHKSDPHNFEVTYWRVKPGGEAFHDRYLITNQCGIAVPSGLELPRRVSPGETVISLLEEDDRQSRLAKYAIPTNVYDTRDEWRISIPPRS